PNHIDAHVRAVDYLLSGGRSTQLNLGTGTGTTVRELVSAIANVSGKPFPVKYTERRDGDSSSLVANSELALRVLGWQPSYDLHDIIRSAWQWHSSRNDQ
ncbi:MAG: UDP-glucose 4-epimerase GalE, partial [Oxalobacteraceae bacterium]